MTTPQEVLAGVPLFSMLPKKEVAKLARQAHELTVPAGTVVTDVDRAGVSFSVIVHCLIFAKWDFRPFAMSHPQTAWALLEVMVQRLRDAENR